MSAQAQRGRDMWRFRAGILGLIATGVLLLAWIYVPILALIASIMAIFIGGAWLQAHYQRPWRRISPDLQRADDTSPGGDVTKTSFAHRIYPGSGGA